MGVGLNGYYQPDNAYGGAWGTGNTGGFAGSPWGQTYQEQNPQASYYRMLQQQGAPSAQTPFGRFVQQQYPEVQLGYQSAVLTNPNLMFADFVNNYLGGMGGLQQRFQQLPSAQRGEFQAQYARPIRPLRWQ